MIEAVEFRYIYIEMQKELEFMQKRMTLYTNKKRLKGPIFKKGDKIYLSWYNICIKQPNDKLDFKKIDPFLIKEKINNLIYEFTLSEGIKIHLRFYISLLEPISMIAKLDTYIETENSITEYEVEAILDYRDNTEEEEYLVK